MRLILAITAVLLAITQSARGDDAAQRADIIKGLKSGYEEAAAATGTPNLIDILEARFPEDFRVLVDGVIKAIDSNEPVTEGLGQRIVVEVLTSIQARDGDKLKLAPEPSLKAVMQAQREILKSAQPTAPDICVAITIGGAAQAPPNKAVGNAFAGRLVTLLQAIADGRDQPVPPHDAAKADYTALAGNAAARGADVGKWSLLNADEAARASPADVCVAAISAFDEIIAEPGENGANIAFDQASGFLVKSAAEYEPALKP
jgi:hypothetical protein